MACLSSTPLSQKRNGRVPGTNVRRSPLPHRQWLRPFPRHDEGAAEISSKGATTRSSGSLRIQMETGRALIGCRVSSSRISPGSIGRCGSPPERCAAKSVVLRARLSSAREFTGSRPFVRQKSFPRQSATLSPGRDLSLPFHDDGGTPSNRCMVAARGCTHLSAHGLVTR